MASRNLSAPPHRVEPKMRAKSLLKAGRVSDERPIVPSGSIPNARPKTRNRGAAAWLFSDDCRGGNPDGPAFCNLKSGERVRFDAMGMEMSYNRGARPFTEGEPSQGIFIMRSGRVKLSITSPEGRTVILRIAGAGDVLDLSAAFTTGVHQISAEALETCRVKVIRVQEFLTFLRKSPEAAMEATRCILQEYQVVFDDICRLALNPSVARRLAALLLDWLKDHHRSGLLGPQFTMSFTRDEIASMIGTSRETVSRILQQFQRKGLISIKASSLTILRPRELQLMR